MRKDPLKVGEVYHIVDKSIARFKIFNDDSEFLRMIETIRYYQKRKPEIKFSKYIKSNKNKEDKLNIASLEEDRLIDVIAYCLMPTHLHLILKQLKENGISIFMNIILNSYTRYFNIKHKRKGPLWEAAFKNILIKTNEQLLHLTRYIHLNPVTAFLVDRPEDWLFSSYCEFLLETEENKRICNYNEILDIEPNSYRKFVEDRISYQRELEKIKDLIIE